MKEFRSLLTRRSKSPEGFTLMELLVVITIIAILAALVLNTAGYVQRKAARSRAESEIKAIEAALESYKADMGDYPTGTNTNYLGGNNFLLTNLMPSTGKVYMEFSKSMISTNSGTNVIQDPFGEAYMYQYPGATNRSGTNFFDLWSRSATANSNQWITNW